MFWFVCAALLVLALGFLFYPLLRLSPANSVVADKEDTAVRSRFNKQVMREQLTELEEDFQAGKISSELYQRSQDELLATVLDDESLPKATSKLSGGRTALVIAAGALVVASVCFYNYFAYGEQLSINQQLKSLSKPELGDEQRRAIMKSLLPVVELQANGEGKGALSYRFLLAQLQAELGRFSESALSYKKVLTVDSSNADVWAMHAQNSYIANGRRMDEVVESSLAQALGLNPHQRMALGLKAMHAFEQGQFSVAASAWAKLLVVMTPGSAEHKLISNAHSQAVANMASNGKGIGSEEAPATASVSVPTSSEAMNSPKGGASVPGVVSIRVSAAINDTSLSGDTTVFVYARAANGPKMPLAIKRLKLSDLPTVVELSDAMAMMPNMKLSMFEEVELIARVSPSGTAAAVAGDWQASSGTVRLDSLKEGISLVIDTQI